MWEMALNLVPCVCITHCPQDINDVEALLYFGNDLNEMKDTGKVVYAAQIYKSEYYDIRKDMDVIIENALVNHDFSVYYQPIYSVEEQRFNSAEALLRLKDEKYGFISPELFIPAAEKSGAIHKIGAFVLDEVCQFIASEEYAGLGLDYIEVNLSVAQCMQSGLGNQILETMQRYGVEPNQINLEITETAASYSQKTMLDNLHQLHEAGVSFSLDDFGTGYSNMRRIAALPLHIVKLDKSFANVEDNPKMQIILQNTIQMIKEMDMKIVVEGIETEQLVKLFSEMQCEYIQGYYYSKPIPRQEFVEFLKKMQSV
jgi:EAL domain-containing protein (putative c-di-GMP-specific phosphodiesterase class I)